MNNFYIGENSLYSKLEQYGVDHYSNLERALQSLSESEVEELGNFQPYIEANGRLGMVIQAELLSLVKGKINGNPEVIQGVIRSIEEFKRCKSRERDEFEDYIKNYSDLSWKEYKELKG